MSADECRDASGNELAPGRHCVVHESWTCRPPRRLTLLSWKHPVLGEIAEVVCERHDTEVLAALRVLGIGSLGTDQHDEFVCLRCQAHPAKLPRELLRQWFGSSGPEPTP